MIWLIYLLSCIVAHKKKGAVIALLIAAAIDGLSEVIHLVLGSAQPVYVFYVGLFLLMFIWWMIASGLKMLSTQIISGIACSFSALLVIDCYFAGGYETTISNIDSYIFILINIATLWAAYNDRDWTYATHCNNRTKDIARHDKVDNQC